MDDYRKAKIISLYNQGWSVVRIAKEVAVYPHEVIYTLYDADVGKVTSPPRLHQPVGTLSGRRAVPVEFTPESVEADFMSGMLPSQIALKYNVRRNKVEKMLLPLKDQLRNDTRRIYGATRR